MSGHTLSLYKDNELNGSVVTLIQSLDSSTLLCKTNSDETDKLKDSKGDGERYMMTGLNMCQESEEYKRLAQSEIELRYISGNTATSQKSKSLSALNIHESSPHHLLLVNERGGIGESDNSLFNVEDTSESSSSCSYLHASNHEHTHYHGNDTFPVGSRTRSVHENDKERKVWPQVWQPGTRAKDRLPTNNNNKGTTGGTEYIAHEDISENGENVLVPASLAAGNGQTLITNNNNNNTDLRSHTHLIQLKSVSSCDSGYLETPPTSYTSQNMKSVDSDKSYYHFDDTFEEYSKTGEANGCGLSFEVMTSDCYLNQEWNEESLKHQRNNINYIDLPQY